MSLASLYQGPGIHKRAEVLCVLWSWQQRNWVLCSPKHQHTDPHLSISTGVFRNLSPVHGGQCGTSIQEEKKPTDRLMCFLPTDPRCLHEVRCSSVLYKKPVIRIKWMFRWCIHTDHLFCYGTFGIDVWYSHTATSTLSHSSATWRCATTCAPSVLCAKFLSCLSFLLADTADRE